MHLAPALEGHQAPSARGRPTPSPHRVRRPPYRLNDADPVCHPAACAGRRAYLSRRTVDAVPVRRGRPATTSLGSGTLGARDAQERVLRSRVQPRPVRPSALLGRARAPPLRAERPPRARATAERDDHLERIAPTGEGTLRARCGPPAQWRRRRFAGPIPRPHARHCPAGPVRRRGLFVAGVAGAYRDDDHATAGSLCTQRAASGALPTLDVAPVAHAPRCCASQPSSVPRAHVTRCVQRQSRIPRPPTSALVRRPPVLDPPRAAAFALGLRRGMPSPLGPLRQSATPSVAC
ncbi:hypothetical protein FHR80_004162 [Cellulomonas cellasea]|uniref:Uncharacterized protein n=1 Tax=Cellulomonas cellasea TaxID=43670 RepID=A0A7W4YE12_9CELL|nr:hypothetical protein [Cellulomonas cellasea]